MRGVGSGGRRSGARRATTGCTPCCVKPQRCARGALATDSRLARCILGHAPPLLMCYKGRRELVNLHARRGCYSARGTRPWCRVVPTRRVHCAQQCSRSLGPAAEQLHARAPSHEQGCHQQARECGPRRGEGQAACVGPLLHPDGRRPFQVLVLSA